MKLTLIVLAAVLGFATAANAVSLSVVSDAATYNVGDTITLTVTGDSMGVAANAIIGRLDMTAGLTTSVSGSQTPHTSFGGALPWAQGVLVGGADFQTVFNQLAGLTPFPVDQLQIATATLTASNLGVVNVTWNANLQFFGVGGAATGTSFTIVPEPTTTTLLGLALFGLVVAARRH